MKMDVPRTWTSTLVVAPVALIITTTPHRTTSALPSSANLHRKMHFIVALPCMPYKAVVAAQAATPEPCEVISCASPVPFYNDKSAVLKREMPDYRG